MYSGSSSTSSGSVLPSWASSNPAASSGGGTVPRSPSVSSWTAEGMEGIYQIKNTSHTYRMVFATPKTGIARRYYASLKMTHLQPQYNCSSCQTFKDRDSRSQLCIARDYAPARCLPVHRLHPQSQCLLAHRLGSQGQCLLAHRQRPRDPCLRAHRQRPRDRQ